MGIDYTQEKLWQAVSELIGRGDIQDRLARAAGFLIRPHLGAEAFPAHPDLEARLTNIIERLTSSPAVADEGTIKATVRRMSDDEAVQIAREILSLMAEATDLAQIPTGFSARQQRG